MVVAFGHRKITTAHGLSATNLAWRSDLLFIYLSEKRGNAPEFGPWITKVAPFQGIGCVETGKTIPVWHQKTQAPARCLAKYTRTPDQKTDSRI